MEASKKRSPVSEQSGVEHIVECTVSANHLDAVHEALALFWRGQGTSPEERWRLLFEVAVTEIAANIIEHARPPVVRFRLRAVSGRVDAEFTDKGGGWDGPPEPAYFLDDLAERGRGLAMAMKAVDEVAYERVGKVNHWRLVKLA
jgi:serine/threonine-protein kinase RsbW